MSPLLSLGHQHIHIMWNVRQIKWTWRLAVNANSSRTLASSVHRITWRCAINVGRRPSVTIGIVTPPIMISVVLAWTGSCRPSEAARSARRCACVPGVDYANTSKCVTANSSICTMARRLPPWWRRFQPSSLRYARRTTWRVTWQIIFNRRLLSSRLEVSCPFCSLLSAIDGHCRHRTVCKNVLITC